MVSRRRRAYDMGIGACAVLLLVGLVVVVYAAWQLTAGRHTPPPEIKVWIYNWRARNLGRWT